MQKLIALLALVALLYGCTGGVSQEKYDSLSASCEQAKEDAASSLAAETAKTSASVARYSACVDEKQELELALEDVERENAALQTKAAVLASARAKMDLAAQYSLTIEYYMEAFGPGNVPNTARLRKIDAHVLSLQDSAFLSLWQGVKNCQGITGCENAKADFIAYIGNRADALAVEAAAIVGSGSG